MLRKIFNFVSVGTLVLSLTVPTNLLAAQGPYRCAFDELYPPGSNARAKVIGIRDGALNAKDSAAYSLSKTGREVRTGYRNVKDYAGNTGRRVGRSVSDGYYNTKDGLSTKARITGRNVSRGYHNTKDAVGLTYRTNKRSFFSRFKPKSTYKTVKTNALNTADKAAYSVTKGYRGVRDGALNTYDRGSLWLKKTGRSVRSTTLNKGDKASYFVNRNARAAGDTYANAKGKASLTLKKNYRGVKRNTAHAYGKTKRSFTKGVAGSVLSNVAITTGMIVADKMRQGGTFKEGVDSALSYVTSPVFYLGDMLGALGGAAIGSMVPLPAFAYSGSLIGNMVGRLPVLGGAMLFATLGATAVQLYQNGNFSVKNLLAAIDLPLMSGQILGASIGAALGTALLPIPGLGSLIGGIAGGMLGGKIAQWLTGRFGEPKYDAQVAADGSWSDKPMNGSVGSSAAVSGLAVMSPIDTLRHQMEKTYELFLNTTDGPAKKAAFETYVGAKNSYDRAMKATGSSF